MVLKMCGNKLEAVLYSPCHCCYASASAQPLTDGVHVLCCRLAEGLNVQQVWIVNSDGQLQPINILVRQGANQQFPGYM